MGKTGFTVKQILSEDFDITSYNAKDVRNIARTLADASHKRIKRLEDKGLESVSPAYQGLEKRLGTQPKLTTNAFDTRNQLLHKIVAMRQFLIGKTSTITGTKNFEKTIDKRMSGYSSLSTEQKKELWKAYEKLKDSAEVSGIGSPEVQQAVLEKILKGYTADEIYNELTAELNSIYEDQVEANDIWNDLAGGGWETSDIDWPSE